MCTVRSGICVHSCEKSERDRWRRTKSIFSLSLPFYFLLRIFFLSSGEKEKEFEILSRTRAHTACCSLAYILAIDSTSSFEISELQSQTSLEDDGNDNREKKKIERRERETYKMDNDDVDGVGSG